MRVVRFICRHPVVFFWLSVLYMRVCSPVCEVYSGSKWLHALVILPVNAVTWPVAYALFQTGNWKRLHFIDRKFVFLLPLISVVLPLAPFLWS